MSGTSRSAQLRVRWFKSFAMPERLAVIQRFRGNGVAQLLLERCRKLAESRGADMLYVQVLPQDAKHWEKQGWRRLEAEDAGSSPKQVVAMIRAVDPSKPLPEADDAPESVVLRRDQQADGSVVPMQVGESLTLPIWWRYLLVARVQRVAQAVAQ